MYYFVTTSKVPVTSHVWPYTILKETFWFIIEKNTPKHNYDQAKQVMFLLTTKYSTRKC